MQANTNKKYASLGNGAAGVKTLVVGDKHGCYNELRPLVNQEPVERINFHGDFLDRGPKCPEAVEFLLMYAFVVSIRGKSRAIPFPQL